MLLGVSLFLGGCAGGAQPRGPISFTAADAVEITYVGDGRQMTLRNPPAQDSDDQRRHGLYGAGTANKHVKFVDHPSLQALANALHELGHFDRSSDQMAPGAKHAIITIINGRPTAWSRPALDVLNKAELERFHTARAAFLHVHDNVMSFHASSVSAEDLSRSVAEQERRNREAVRNLLQKARGQ